MKITFLLTQSLESPGGAGRFFPLASALTERGHAVKILALHHNYAQASPRRFVRDGVDVHYVGQMHVRKTGNRKYYYSPLKLLWVTAVATLKLTWAALVTPSDIIHVCKTQPMNGVAARIVNLLRRTPVFLDSDDYEAVNNRFGGVWQQRIVAWFENWMPSFASGITVNTSFLVNHFQQLGYPINQIALVPNGADRKRFAILDSPDATGHIDDLRRSLNLMPHHRIIVYIGSMSLTSHAVDLLLEAFAQVQIQEPDALLLLIGSGEDIDYLKQLSQKLNINDFVRFVGRVPVDNIPFYYRLGELTVDPLLDSLPAQSSLSLKLVESIVAGVPCVTADIGDRRSIVGSAGIAVTPNDAAALAKGILTILHDPALAEGMRHATRKLRETLWWDVRAQEFVCLYPQQ